MFIMLIKINTFVDKFNLNFYKKNVKKTIDQYILRWYSYTCPWDKGKQVRKTSEKRGWQRKTALIK